MGKKKHKERPLPQSLGLPCTGVETHAHLDMEPFEADLEAVMDRALECGVARTGNVFMGPDAWEKGRDRFAHRPEIFFTLGMHPHEASACSDDVLARMRAAHLEDERIKGWGEIGLDFHYDYSPRDVQEQRFRDQLSLAREIDTPVIIHCREALAETLAILDDMGFRDRPLMWHCFGGDAAMADEVLGRGWHISLPGPVTFPKSTALREAVATIPLDRLVLETDCPYLTPHPYRGKRNEPAYLVFTAAEVAALRGMQPEDLWTACGETAIRFFGL